MRPRVFAWELLAAGAMAALEVWAQMTEPAPFRILVVEDEPVIRELVRSMLHDGPVEVETAANGVEGLKRARTQTFHLILLDVVLPLMDGVTVCRMLKGDPVTAGVPLYMLTAKVKKADMEAALAAGADGYIHKPFRAAELMELVDRHRERRG
jgi:two-component system, OmpR family, phosphate regulon response regulator PhoB